MATLDYATYVTTLANLMVQQEDGDDFVQILPSIIDYAEQRIYRELALLTQVATATGNLTQFDRNFTFPEHFVTTTTINVVTPIGVSDPDDGVRQTLMPASRSYMDLVWGSSAETGVPNSFCMMTDQTIVVGPWPDAAYLMEIIGTQRPTPLSAINDTTWLTLYVPDLFIAASMVFGSGWMRNFGSQADNPQMSQSWETQYQALKASADAEEMRKRMSGAI